MNVGLEIVSRMKPPSGFVFCCIHRVNHDYYLLPQSIILLPLWMSEKVHEMCIIDQIKSVAVLLVL